MYSEHGKNSNGEPLRMRIAERFGVFNIYYAALRRRVPKSPWYLSDGATLTLFLAVQITTGVILTLYYTDAPEYAYDSIVYITNSVPLGWLVRALHYWSAGLMVVTLIVHVFRHLVLGGYKAPREGTWTIGVFLFFLVWMMSLTGYVLRWDERALYAARVALSIFQFVPFIGTELVILVQGGVDIGSTTLSRFFSAHVWLFPLILIGFTGYHLYLVVIHGVTHKEEWRGNIKSAKEHKKIYKEVAESEEGGEWFYPDTMVVSGTIAFAIFCGSFILALVLGPAEMYPEANLTDRSFPVEEWWFAWYSSLSALLPPWLAPVFHVAGPLLVFVGMLSLPLVDRGPNRGVIRRPFWTAFVVLNVIVLFWLSDLRIRSPWTAWPQPDPPPVPAEINLTEDAQRGRVLFSRYGCTSCHAIASYGRVVGPDLARIDSRLSPSELYNYILRPPDTVPMPGYEGRISDMDLEKIVTFVLVTQTFSR